MSISAVSWPDRRRGGPGDERLRVVDERMLGGVLGVERRWRGRLFVGELLRAGRPASHGAERLALQARHVARVGTAEPLQLEVLANGIVKQSHREQKPYLARTVLFLPERFAS